MISVEISPSATVTSIARYRTPSSTGSWTH